MQTIIDLTYDLEEGMPTFGAPWHVPLEITQLGRHGFEGRETRKITFGTHTGTQIDAPLHFVKGGKSIDGISLHKFIGSVKIVDFSHLGKNGVVTKTMLETISLEKRMIFKFGWGKYWNSKQFYLDYPFFAPDAAEYLVAKGVDLVGFDTPSPDDSRIRLQGDVLGTSQDSPIHKIFLGNDVVLLEYLAHLDQVTDYNDWVLIALPLKIKGADGSPARVCIYKNSTQNNVFEQSGLGEKTVGNDDSIIKTNDLALETNLPKTQTGESSQKYRVEYDRPGCIGAAACVAVQPERWVIKDEVENKADLVGGKEDPNQPGMWILEITEEELQDFISAATMCPVQVIKIFNIKTGEQLTW